MILRIFAISVTALVAGSFIENARAGQFFVCDDGAAIEIETSRLEEAKRTIPCVAAHFGLKVVTKPTVAEIKPNVVAVEPKVEAQHSKRDEALAVRLPEAQTPEGRQPSVLVLPVRRPSPPKMRGTDTDPPPAVRQGSRLIADAANTDHTRVRIINARPGAAKWFQLSR